jgi:hypothetical protein
MAPAPHASHDAVLRFIDAPESARFEDLALDIFAHQFDLIPAYRRVCERRGRTPALVRDWRQIPPVPALAFKQLDLHCDTPERTFLTTGTTQGGERRGRHCMPDLRLYRASAIGGLKSFLFPDTEQMRIRSLLPTAAMRPESSLAQMGDWALEVFGDSGSTVHAAADRFDFDSLAEAVRQSERDGSPVCVMTTTGALIRFLDHCRDRSWAFRLPHGSRLMDTGGAKGAPRTLSRNGILHACWNTLAIPGYFVTNEYGMTELSSQFYDNVIRDRWQGRFTSRAKAGPPWIRTRILDPGTLEEVAPGETGLLCHTDLANAGTALVVLTEDLGRSTESGFDMLGRVAGAEARGCSLAVEDFIA